MHASVKLMQHGVWGLRLAMASRMAAPQSRILLYSCFRTLLTSCKNNHFTELCSGSETGSYLRLIGSCVTQLKAQGPSRTCNESKEEEGTEQDLVVQLLPHLVHLLQESVPSETLESLLITRPPAMRVC